MKRITMLLLVPWLLFPAICLADKIQGHACYTYGDSESLLQAEQIAKALAIRNAIESYTVFIESTTQITDFQLTQDLLKTVSAGQVKGVKVLKRLESGRTLCYTVEGFVDPPEMQAAIREYLKGKIDDVRLQDNGWIRILDYFYWETTMEEVERIRSGRVDKNLPDSFKNWKMKFLNVKIMFLKPCKAKTLSHKMAEATSKEELARYNSVLNFLLVWKTLKDEGKEAECDKLMRKLDEMPIEKEILNKYYLFPEYECDYRNKLFVTFFFDKESKIEMETKGQYPIAGVPEGERRKFEILPGETLNISFVVPESAKSWKVWVPK